MKLMRRQVALVVAWTAFALPVCAVELKIDPLDFRLAHLDDERGRAALRKAVRSSIAKPLAMFAVLYTVFGRFFRWFMRMFPVKQN